MPDGAHGLVVELPGDAAELGIVWLRMSDTLDTMEYSPLELALEFGSGTEIEALRTNHEMLASTGRFPVEPRTELRAEAERSAAEIIEPGSWCGGKLGTVSAGAFGSNFADLSTSCWGPGGICGSAFNFNMDLGVTLTDYFIVTAPSTEHAIATCNAIPSMPYDSITARLERFIGPSSWEIFYTLPIIAPRAGLGFAAYGWSIQQYRMRVSGVVSGNETFAAAQW